MQLLEHFIREDLNKRAPRVMAVLRPLKIVIDNYSEQGFEELEAVNNPEDLSAGTRPIPFSRTLYIERDDFMEEPPKEFFRLAPGREVRLRYAYIIKCVGVTKHPRTEEVNEVHCTYDRQSKSGAPEARRKVKATIHWVSASHALDAEVRLYNPLLKADLSSVPADHDWTANLNPQSLERLTGCQVEPSLRTANAGSRFQFERLGYFCVDPDSSPDQLVFNRTVSLKDAWARLEKRQSVR
jgi:glutaminyl-tRNA synthetase